MTKAEQARKMLSEGMSPAKIAEVLNTSKQYIYDLKSRGNIAKRKPGRPKKNTVTVVKAEPVQHAPLERNAERVLRDEVLELRAIIRYLESKINGAAV